MDGTVQDFDVIELNTLVHGQVTDQDGNPVSGAYVDVRGILVVTIQTRLSLIIKLMKMVTTNSGVLTELLLLYMLTIQLIHTKTTMMCISFLRSMTII